MQQINLNGEWELSSLQSPHIQHPMMIPGDHYSALLQAGEIVPPYYGCNETDVQWVRECDWRISRSFTVSPQTLQANACLLILSRVDTVASVSINGQPVFECSNQFRRYQKDIKSWLCLGENVIEITFYRADEEARKRAEKLPFPIPSAMGNNQIPHMNTLRKTQCHSGWDWGICLMVSGIYDPIALDCVDKVHIEQVSTEQHWHLDGSVEVVVDVECRCWQASDLRVEFADQIQSARVSQSGTERFRFTVAEPRRWWPAGYGEQYLYPLAVACDGHVVEKQLGLRQLVLNTAEDDIGSAMEFVVNGFPIVAKGANWIPLDAMPSRESRKRYRELLESAVAANMNMIRVWGGGQYESDEFYQLCDELGLLVWQDMMFACSLYPSTDDFVADVELELQDQLKRLKDHACIALWCGDNEVIGAIGWYDESKHNKVKYTVNYDRLNRRIADVVAQEDSSRTFWPSSPCNGDLDFGDAWHDDNRGDMHFWDVWHSGKSFDAYRQVNPRFCSEFGYQSWPSLAEVKQFVPEQDWNVTSPTFEYHQKNPRGNSIITEMFTRYFKFPAGFDQMLYLSQVQQAIAIKTACDHWRAISPVCRGMLFWQLNDNWPVSSWSSIEYSGRWKQLHYHAKRFFSAVYLPFELTETQLQLRLVNDLNQEQSVTGTLVWMSWQGETLAAWSIDCVAEPDSNIMVWHMAREEAMATSDKGFFYLKTEHGSTVLENTWMAASNWKSVPIAKAKIKMEIDGDRIRLSTDKPAFFVHLECDVDGRFSDSSMTLLPGEPIDITFHGNPRFAESLRLYQLADIC
ncbi:glycosyl hydrolase 2 galactose-binding domain-containing protein [Vibrio sp. TRT 21S02]|uniref:beta-mannosidase n=1 Tax=Vibrio sp. TRT 21S02 TaxID=3418507 RepID=UPI003CF16AE4